MVPGHWGVLYGHLLLVSTGSNPLFLVILNKHTLGFLRHSPFHDRLDSAAFDAAYCGDLPPNLCNRFNEQFVQSTFSKQIFVWQSNYSHFWKKYLLCGHFLKNLCNRPKMRVWEGALLLSQAPFFLISPTILQSKTNKIIRKTNKNTF